ncbi:MAG: chromate efflux transporter [Chloroflexota bacterium]
MGRRGSLLEVLAVAFRLGLTSFGGPVAHIGYFREEYVNRRRWVDESTFADLVALSQFLPGPASTKVGISLGILRAGLPGGFLAWLGFTAPSAIALAVLAYGVAGVGAADRGWLHGLKVVAVAVVAQAIWGMARTLCTDRPRQTMAIAAAVLAFALPGLGFPSSLAQVTIIAVAGLLGWWLLQPTETAASGGARDVHVPIGHGLAIAAWVAFFALLLVLPLLRGVSDNGVLALVDGFYRSGALVFGGGHVVLPLLQAEVVPPGWVSQEQFLAGYGAAQAVPGPLFTFAAYLGAAYHGAPTGWLGALIAIAAIFLPGFLLVIGSLPYWQRLRGRADAQGTLRGINASVVGLLLAAFYQPVWTSAIQDPADFCLGIAAFGLLMFWKTPPWLVVALTAAVGAVVT